LRRSLRPARDFTSSFLGEVGWLVAFFFTAVVSGCVGYLFGQRALSGVSSPVTETSTSSASRVIRDPRTVPLLNEAEVIAAAEALLRPPSTPTPLFTPPPVAIVPPHSYSSTLACLPSWPRLPLPCLPRSLFPPLRRRVLRHHLRLSKWLPAGRWPCRCSPCVAREGRWF
jgi:hypothetical protein